MCGNIAGASGIAVGPPGAANVITLLDDQERVESGFAELDGHTQAGKACAHNQDIHCRISRRAIYERAVGHEEVMIMVMCPACLDKYMSEQSEEWCYFSLIDSFQVASLLCPLLFA